MLFPNRYVNVHALDSIPGDVAKYLRDNRPHGIPSDNTFLVVQVLLHGGGTRHQDASGFNTSVVSAEIVHAGNKLVDVLVWAGEYAREINAQTGTGHEVTVPITSRAEGIAFLEMGGKWMQCFSKYGRNTHACAPVAWRFAFILAKELGEAVTTTSLDHAMGLVVNEHDDVASLIREYGHGMYV